MDYDKGFVGVGHVREHQFLATFSRRSTLNKELEGQQSHMLGEKL